jgi:FkbM family methyltransferase
MNLKLKIGNLIKKAGGLSFALKFVRKFGYLTRYGDEHASGIDLAYDISQNKDVKKVRTILDVGASVGSMTEKFLHLFPKSTIHAFEPYSVSFDKLKKRYNENLRVIPNKLAISDKPGELKMYIKKDSGYNSLSENSNIPDSKNNNLSEIVDITTIDAYCKENDISKIDFLKIDTEGLEIKVLLGAESMLKAGKIIYIYAECTFDKEYTQNTYFEKLYEFLKQYNFKLRAIYDQSTFGNTSYISCINALFMLQENKQIK